MGSSPRYLSAAQWGQLYQENASGILAPGEVRPLQSVSGIMVFGQRTGAQDIPASGGARYSLVSLINRTQDDIGYDHPKDLATLLDVDFATRRLSATYDLAQSFDEYQLDDEGYAVLDDDGNARVIGRLDTKVHAAGSTTVANDGGFGIDLAGTGNVQTIRQNGPTIGDISRSVTGSLSGAFFGPQAAEVGGISALPQIQTDGTVYTSFDAFAGQRASP